MRSSYPSDKLAVKNQQTHEEKNGDWLIRTILNHANGPIKKIFLYRGNISTIIHFNTKKALGFCAYALIEKDLQDAKEFFLYARKLMEKSETRHIYNSHSETKYAVKGLLKAAVMNYWKAFDPNSRRPGSLNKSRLPKELKVMDEYFDEIRNQYAAHGGKSEWEASKLYLGLAPKNKLKKKKSIQDSICHHHHLWQVIWAYKTEYDFERLILAAQRLATDKLKLLDTAVSAEINSINVEKLYVHIGKNSEFTINDSVLKKLSNDK